MLSKYHEKEGGEGVWWSRDLASMGEKRPLASNRVNEEVGGIGECGVRGEGVEEEGRGGWEGGWS